MGTIVSAKEAEVLALLAPGRELFGLQLVELAGGRLKRGTVYVTLGRMEEKGLVASRLDDTPRPEASGKIGASSSSRYSRRIS